MPISSSSIESYTLGDSYCEKNILGGKVGIKDTTACSHVTTSVQ